MPSQPAGGREDARSCTRTVRRRHERPCGMRPFYSPNVSGSALLAPAGPAGTNPEAAPSIYSTCARARIAVYGQPGTAPRVLDVGPSSLPALVERLSCKIHELCRDQGADVPYTVIREVVENFVHADFVEPVISILESGTTVRFSDHGPGFADKERAVLPGFTTARGPRKSLIRGVGSGLPTVVDYLRLTGGSLEIDDNIGGGAVVTLRFRAKAVPRALSPAADGPPVRQGPLMAPPQAAVNPAAPDVPSGRHYPRLSSRQHQVLALVLETGEAGPSMVSRELGVGVSTAYRDLAALEEAGLITSEAGRRTLTPEGASFLDELLNHN